MVAVDRTGRVRELVIKLNATKLKLGWIFAVWTSMFTEFMHEYLLVPRTAAELPDAGSPAELTVGTLFKPSFPKDSRPRALFFLAELTSTSARRKLLER
jgi:hypothetical protein